MPHTPFKCPSSLSRATFGFVALLALIFTIDRSALAQTAETLSQVKKVYVEPFGQESGASKLHDGVIEQLRKKKKLQVVASSSEADAVIKGSGSIWVTGYTSTNPRSPSNARQPLFQGFLSVEVIGKDHEPLWSYLVTPSKFRAGDITSDLAGHLVTKLLADREQMSERPPTTAKNGPSGEMTITAAGATFPAPLYQKWFEVFQEQHPAVHIKYNAVGSETGLQLFADGKVDLAASDMPLSDEKMSQSNAHFLQFASVLGAVVPVYNLKGMNHKLNFTPEVLAGIYLGKIKKWNDLKIRESNRNADLPDSDILVIHRSDGSGTTFVWTEFLSKLSPEWKSTAGTGSTVRWPMGIGAVGNEGVATSVQQTPNSIGYVELVYALRHQLNYGAVQNAAGEFILADISSVTVAAAQPASAVTSDFRVSITNATGKGAYPIATFTWWILPQNLGSEDKRAILRELLQWMLTSGQKQCSALGYAPLPREIANRELQVLNAIK